MTTFSRPLCRSTASAQGVKKPRACDDQGNIASGGNAYLDKTYPGLTFIKKATIVLLATWCVYPIAYLFPIFDETSETLEVLRQVGYTIADVTAKALYGLMILGIAKARTAAEEK